MKIMIIGSMKFAKEMIETQEKLRSMGHEVDIPCDADLHVADPLLRDDSERDIKHSQENNIMHRCFELVAKSDAVLVLNHRNNEIDGYVGASALMESGIAAYLGKKIFLLNPIAETERYRNEFTILRGVVIDGDLSRIS